MKLRRHLPIKRHERLHRTYEMLVQLVMYEGTLISDRTNSYLLFNSILFATLAILPNRAGCIDILIILKMAFPILGLTMSVFQSIIIARTIDAADYWRSTIGLIEKDQDFWSEKKPNDIDLDVFSARKRYINGDSTRQQENPLKLCESLSLINRLSVYLPHPNRIYVFWLPFLIGILWLLALIWILTG